MNAISIEELAASDLQHNTDYQKQGVCLTGELEYCEHTSDFTRDYDCLMLIDPDSFTGIKCRTTAFDRSLIGVPVKVNVWFLQTFEEPLLNISMTESIVEETEEPLSKFIENARARRVESWIESDMTFRKLSMIDDREAFANLVSIVVVKSAMYLDQEKKPYFVVQIAQDDIASFITIRGKDIRQHYSEIEIDNYYIFEHIELVMASPNAQPMLLFDGSKSDQCKLSFKEAAIMLDRISTFDPPTESSALLQPYDSLSDRNYMGSYTGLVTTVIDPILGLYVLDKKWFLALTQCPAYNPLASYLEGSKITVKRAHLTSFHTNTFGSTFLNQFCQCSPVTTSQENTWLTLVACTHTSITLEALPTSAPARDHAAISSPSIMEAFIANNGFAYQHGYLDMVIWMEAYLSLQRKTRDIDQQSLIKITNSLLEKTRQRSDEPQPRDLYQEFIQHATRCLLCSYETHTDEVNPPRLHLQNYPSISQLACQRPSIPNLIEVPITSSVHNENPLSNITMQAYTYKLSNTEPFSCVLLGYISGGVDGRLYFADAGGRIPVVLTNKQPHHFLSTSLHIITNCTFVKEDLGYMDPNGEPVDCSSQYLLVKWEDVVPLQANTQTITFCTTIPNNILQNRLFAYDPRPSLTKMMQQDCHVIHIEHVQVPYLTFDDYGKLYLACYVDATVFDLVPSAEAPSQRLKESALRSRISLSSASKTLALLSYMQVGGWYVLQNGSQETALSSNVIELVQSASVYPILPNHGQFKLEQYMSHSYSIPSMGAPVDNTNIRSVKDILNIDFAAESEPDSPVKLSNGFYKNLVSFEGYVVIKEFTESRIKTSGLDKYTHRIYEHLGVGTGKPNRWLYMRIRCVDSPDTIDIYYDVSKTLYPHGLIPGCKVQLCKISLKETSRTETVYGVVVPRTRVQVIETGEDTELNDFTNIEQAVENRPLVEFLRTTDTKIYKTVCTVRSIQQVNISWICLECGQRIIKDMCFGTCSKEKRMFLADAVFTVTDGTADITVSAHGEDMVMTLLRLSSSEVSKLKEAAWMQGELSYSNWFTKADSNNHTNVSPVTRTLHSICTNTKIFESLCLYVKRIIRQKSTCNTADSLLGKLSVLPIKLNSDGVQSLTFSRVRLDVLKLEVISAISEATALL
ncbi:CST, telomere maintenance, complex subunit CTC1-domain-containing protein [Umbelopsis sp. AD052]|nr:CST, telomere maintenance, complex subunit CTC1-domain-containing protein [Umbelopsis sp. AD052]